MATYSSNTTVKISAKVSQSAVGPATLYTVPANCYIEFIANIIPSAPTNQINVDGLTVFSVQITSGAAYPSNGSNPTVINVSGYTSSLLTAGPGAVISSSGIGASFQITGTLFINTP